jgi:hypothetical protein
VRIDAAAILSGRRHRSRASFRFPQCGSFRSGLNTRSTLRCSARITPDPGEHSRPDTRDEHQGLHRCLPLRGGLIPDEKIPRLKGSERGRGKFPLCSTRISDSDWETPVFKLGHCENQIRPQGVKTGQYQKLGFAVGPSGSDPASVAELKCFPQIMSRQIGDHPSAAFDRGQRVFRQANLASAPHPMGSLYRIWPRAPR